MHSITARLNEPGVILLDGAMGTELFRRGVQTRLPSWSARALVENPGIVRDVHEDYIHAGTEIITTNTFRTTSRALEKVRLGHRAKEMTCLAVNLAKEARDRCATKPVWVAGSVAPLEDCYEPELTPDPETAFREHSELIGWLVDAGVDLILIETMNTIAEAAAASRAARTSGVPMFVSWTCGADGRILDGESISEAARALEAYGPAALLINCTPAEYVGTPIRELLAVSKTPVGAYANIGKAEPIFGWEFTHELSPLEYARYAEEWIRDGAKIVGGCCGTTPDHISALKA